MAWLRQINWPDFSGIVEILLLAVAFYYVILFFRGTRSAQVLAGLAVVLTAMLLLTRLVRLDTLNWLLQRFTIYLAISIVIIFQPEIRRALAELGKPHVFSSASAERGVVNALVQAVMLLAERKIGALVAVEREIGTRSIQETGVRLDALVSPELLATIFFPHTPLHDGGVIIRADRIAAAACLFPLSQQDSISRALGTRHRAAVGMSEETDAIVLVVSEETGTISVAYNGRLNRGFDEERLRRLLNAVLARRRRPRSRMDRARAVFNLTAAELAERPTGFNEGKDGHG
jgi:diadenylate cyclase